MKGDLKGNGCGLGQCWRTKLIMDTYPRSVIWKCQTCRVCGVASITEQSSINSVIGFIIRDHGEKSPKCESGDNEIRIQSEEMAA